MKRMMQYGLTMWIKLSVPVSTIKLHVMVLTIRFLVVTLFTAHFKNVYKINL